VGSAANAAAGIHVSKATLDACLLKPDWSARDRAFPDTPAGFAALLPSADAPARSTPGRAVTPGERRPSRLSWMTARGRRRPARVVRDRTGRFR
jgi:hypothetical protein